MAIDETMSMRERCKTASIQRSQISVRRQRIERWVYKGRNISINDKVLQSSASLRTSLIQKRSESLLIQADRRLNIDLYQLGEQREKLLKRHNFNQKLFANKQALRHKDNQDVQRTLDYVRKCCKYSDMNENEGEFIDPTIFFEEGRSTKTNRSRSLATITPAVEQSLPDDTQTQNNVERFLEDNENQKRHVQFQMNTKRGSQSAHVSTKHRSLINEQRAKSAHGIRITNSAPPRTTIYHRKESIKSKRPSSRIFSTKNSLQEFRRYPERFLSQSNRYLPLLRRQMTEIESHELHSKKQNNQSVSRFSDGSEFTFDDAKSFLSEENEANKSTIHLHLPVWDSHDRRNTHKLHAPNKINLIETVVDNTSERTLAISRLRDREYTHLQRLIRSNSIEHILEPLSSMKTLENEHQQSMNLDKILHSVDSLRCSKTRKKHKKQQIDIEKNLSKFGILIF